MSRHQGEFTADHPPCPQCKQNDDVTLNGIDKKTSGQPMRYRCSKCRRSFRYPYRREQKAIDFDMHKLAKNFVYGKADIDVLAAQAGIPRSTFYARMRKYISKLPSADEQTRRLESARQCVVMGIDTAIFKIRKQDTKQWVERSYLLVIDNLTGSLIYEVLLEQEDGPTLITILRRIRDELRCSPKLITCDLGPAILHALKEVFPEALIEGCWFHEFRRLEARLPTTNKGNGRGQDTRLLWIEVKHRILKALIAVDGEHRARLLNKLNSTNLGRDRQGRATRAIKNFRKHCELGYYHTQDILRGLVNTSDLSRLVYNNMPESRFKDPRKRSKETRLWTREYFNAYHIFKREDKAAENGAGDNRND